MSAGDRESEGGARSGRRAGSGRVSPVGSDREARGRRFAREAPWRLVETPEWGSRGYLPHFDAPGVVQMVTFRLFDSLPVSVLEKLRLVKEDSERRRRIEASLDAGYGACSLRNPAVASVVEGALLYFDAQRYRMLAWSVMPNHVHTLFETFAGHPLAEVLHSWKSFSAHEANRILSRSGTFWETESCDRFIRDEEHYRNAVRYIEERNPSRCSSAARERMR